MFGIVSIMIWVFCVSGLCVLCWGAFGAVFMCCGGVCVECDIVCILWHVCCMLFVVVWVVFYVCSVMCCGGAHVLLCIVRHVCWVFLW